MQYAEEAYKTAGLSANEYMEQVTGFSASLITSLNGSTDRAAVIANKAIKDMSDNANTFGTDIESIQNAYAGFAKENYTMLDNLKLGYSGSKEGMEALLAKAEEITGTKFELGNFADMVNAIHAVQEEMNIAGTTANEAEGTIEGSINTLKGAWDNLITGLGNDEANIPQLVENVISSAGSVLENIIPTVKEILRNIPEAIKEVNPEAGAAFEEMLNIIQPVLDNIKEISGTAFDLIIDAITFIGDHTGLIAGLATAIGIVVTAIGLYNAVQAVKTALDAAQVTTLWALVAAQTAALAPYLLIVAAIAAVIAIVVLCIKHWDDIKAAVANAWNFIKEKTVGAVDAVKQKFADMKQNISDKVQAIKDSIKEKFEAAKEAIEKPIEKAKEKVKGVIDKIKGFFKFEWNLPKLKMPHVKIEGEFSLVPPKVPKFSIDWYAQGGVFDKPALFGYNGRIGGLGEAGAEAIVPLERNTKWLTRIADMLAERQGSIPIVLEVDGKTFAQTSVASINQLTKQTGKLGLVIE